MYNKLVLLSLVLLLVATAAMPVSAGYSWCMTDPNILLPEGGVVHLLVGVPEEFVGVSFDLAVWAPAGARIVGSTHGINVTLHEGPANQVTATANANFPVMLVTKFQGKIPAPGEVIFATGHGTATWTW
jgi:hypothetical protein